MSAAQLAAAVAMSMLQELLQWQQRIADGKITMDDVDAKIEERRLGSRQELVDAIAARKADAA